MTRHGMAPAEGLERVSPDAAWRRGIEASYPAHISSSRIRSWLISGMFRRRISASVTHLHPSFSSGLGSPKCGV